MSAHRSAPVLLVCLLLSGCGATSAQVGTSTPDDLAYARAVALVTQMRDAGLPVRDVVVCTPPAPAPSDHPRPPAVAFDDARVSTGVDRHVVREGGVVEVHASAAHARTRVRQLDDQTLAAQALGFDEGGQPLHAERRVRVGAVLLRLSGALPARVQRTYAAELAQAATAGPVPSLLDSPLELLDGTKEAPCST